MQDDPFARAVDRAHAAEQAEAAAKRHQRQVRWSAWHRTALRTHGSVYIAVNLLLVAIWFTTWQFNGGTSNPWFIYPLLAWGVGLAAHFAATQSHLSAPSAPGPGLPGGLVGGASPASAIDDLERLADLHDSGALTDDEFTAAKSKLLG